MTIDRNFLWPPGRHKKKYLFVPIFILSIKNVVQKKDVRSFPHFCWRLRGGVPFLRVYKRWFIAIWCHLTQRSENRLGVRRKELRDNNNLRDRNLRSQAEIFTEFQYNLRNWPCFCKVGRFLHLVFRKNSSFILDISKLLT